MNKTLKKLGIYALSGMLFGGFAGGAFVGVTYASNLWNPDTIVESDVENGNESENEQVQIPLLSSDINKDKVETTNSGFDVSDIAKLAMPSIVAITNKSVQEVQSYFSLFGRGNQVMQKEVESSGSGIIIGKNETELLIATNNHVIEGAKMLSVCFIDDQVYNAYTKGTDADNDLAVIAVKISDIKKDTLSQIQVIQIGNSEDLKVGEQVVAIGNALGYGQSVTTGIVSAKNRQIGESEKGFIQTDAAINPGNSGGALLNMKGELIGINSAKLADTLVEGMGYAIPVSVAAPIINELMHVVVRDKVSEAEAGTIGIEVRTVTETITQMYGIPVGVYVTNVRENSAAEKAGLKAGYVITKFDKETVKSSEELTELLAYYAAGETVELTVKFANHGEYAEKTVLLTLDAAEKVSNTRR